MRAGVSREAQPSAAAGDRAALWVAICAAPDDDLPRLVFADWLDEHGDPELANYIRVRCALDGKPFPYANYPTLFEQWLEAEAGVWLRPDPEMPAGFHLCRNYGSDDEWWSDVSDGSERGLPSTARLDTTVFGQRDEPAVAAALAARLPGLIDTTTVRGLDFAWYVRGHLGTVLGSPGGRHLRRVSFSSRPDRDQPCPDIAALAASPAARTLKRIEINEGAKSTADVLALTAARFDSLRRFDCYHFNGDPAAIGRLTAAPWFRRLHRLLIGFPRDRRAGAIVSSLHGMPDLHTLSLWHPGGAAGRLGSFPSLARLFVIGANLTGDPGRRFGRARVPRLVELWLRNSTLKADDIRGLIDSPLFDGLRALTFDSAFLGQRGLAALAARPCAANLRILRLKYAGVQNFANTPFIRPGAFPALTTLTLNSPSGESGKARGFADLLAGFASPSLRHLALEYCDFDDACAAALAANPAFAGLTRLTIRWGTMGPEAAERLFRSDNLRNLVELQVHDCPVGKAAGELADPDVMPALLHGTIDGCKVPSALVKRLKDSRPTMYVSDLQ